MEGFAVVATHHKTGSVWMLKVFRKIAARFNIAFFKMRRGGVEGLPAEPPAVIFNSHSNFANAPWLLEHPLSRILHLIRDPRDIVISGMHYHRTAREKWLHRHDPALDGMTYQQKLNALPDDYSRYLFEMQHSAKRTIQRLRKWNYALPNSMECKYEDLIRDVDMVIFTRIFAHLGFSTDEHEECRKQLWSRSLFGEAKYVKPGHVGSTRRSWQTVFDRNLAAQFVREFDNVLVELGYEQDDAWIERCENAPTQAVSGFGAVA